MPDEIRQELGFDATQTLAVLSQLEAAFERFGNALRGAGNQINSLNQAGAKLDEGLKQSSNMAPEVARIFEQTRTPQEQYAAQMNKLNAMLGAGAINQETYGRAALQAADALEHAGKSAHAFTISWETLSRVVMTQAIVRTMSMIRDGIKESYEAFLDFSKRVGEIRAIDPSRTFDQIAQSVREMSDAFNQPLARTAEAQYQMISDQFTTAADRVNIMTAANALSKVTAQDLADSVMLLTGALNAYGESSDNAGLRAAQFDKTIELGRLRMGELGTAMGRVQTLAHEVGVSMEELQAAFVSITIGGVKAAEAATQIRSVLTALMKPSQGMKEALRALNVESGEAAVATWGYQGALEKLRGTTDGSASAMARLFPNVRGDAGALRLAGEGADKFREALEELHQVDMETLSKKLKEFTSTDAERLTAELNKVANYFKVEFGAEVVHSLAQIMDVLGGGIVPTLRIATSQLTTLVAAGAGLAIVAAGFGAMKLQAMLAAEAISGVRAGVMLLVGLPIAQSLGQMIGNKLYDIAASSMRAVKEQTDQEVRMYKEQAEAQIRESDRKNKEIIKGLRQYVAEASKSYTEDAENFKTAVKITEQVVKLAFDRIMQSRQKMTQELLKASEDASKRAGEIPQQIADIQAGMADRAFQQEISRYNPEWQLRELAAKASQIADDAARKIGSAKDAEQMKVAEAEWKRAEGFAKQASEIAKQQGGYQGLVRANEILNDLDNKRISALIQQRVTQQQLAQEAEARAHQAESHNLELEKLREAIEERLKTTKKDTDDSIRFKGAKELGEDLLKAQALIDQFAQKLRDYNKEDFVKNFLGDPRAFEALKREAERQLAGMNLKEIQAAPTAIAAMHDQLQGSLNQMKLEVPVLAKLEKITGLDIIADGLNKVLDAYEKRLGDITARNIREAAALASLEAERNQFQAASTAFWKEPVSPVEAGGGITQATADRIKTAREQMASAVMDMDRLAHQSATLTDEDMKRVAEDATRVKEALSTALPGVGSMMERARIAEEVDKMVGALQRMQEFQRQAQENAAKAGEPRKAEVDAIQQQIDALNRKKAAEAEATKATEGSTQAAQATKTAMDDQLGSMQQGIAVAGELAQAWQSVAMAAASAAQAAAAASLAGSGGGMDASGFEGGLDFFGPELAAMGGLMRRLALGGIASHFDRGGYARRGTDVIPAMLSPGEFVMSARATRRFYSQLVAMNAGYQPAHRASGGPVTNAGIVGDVTVNEESGGEDMGHKVVRAINREIRRGTSKLYG